LTTALSFVIDQAVTYDSGSMPRCDAR